MEKRKFEESDLESQDEGGSTATVMHPRNIYAKRPPDFRQLGQEFPQFRPFVRTDSQGKPRIDFKDPDAVRELTRTLLKRDFGLDVILPADRLCPPVPSRLNYILWIEDIIEEALPASEPVTGIDIGVGASCIYPLLGCARNSHWKFIGTDIDPSSVKSAEDNVKRNNMADRITIKYNDVPSRIFLLDENESYTFCMCNPPFYASREELEEGRKNKELEPSAVCTGTDLEMVTDGGEYGFISRIINESRMYKQRIKWYTSLVGLKRTIRPLIQQLKTLGIVNYAVTEFNQGRTKRWGIAWSFGPTRINRAGHLEEYAPKSQFVAELPKPVSSVQEQLTDILQDLQIKYQKDESGVFSGAPLANTWSRAARRKKQKVIPEQNGPIFRFEIECETGDTDEASRLVARWTSSDNRELFMGFWNHVKKRVEEACGLSRGTAFAKRSKSSEVVEPSRG